jgi:predicted transcriptional regulator
MSMKPITFEVPEESLATLDEIAENLGETRDCVLRHAIALYLEDYKRECEEVTQAERQIDAGNFLTQEQMETRFQAKIHRTEAA